MYMNAGWCGINRRPCSPATFQPNASAVAVVTTAVGKLGQRTGNAIDVLLNAAWFNYVAHNLHDNI